MTMALCPYWRLPTDWLTDCDSLHSSSRPQLPQSVGPERVSKAVMDVPCNLQRVVESSTTRCRLHGTSTTAFHRACGADTASHYLLTFWAKAHSLRVYNKSKATRLTMYKSQHVNVSRIFARCMSANCILISNHRQPRTSKSKYVPKWSACGADTASQYISFSNVSI